VLDKLRPRRWVAVLGLVVGIAVLTASLAAESSIVSPVLVGLLGAAATMAVFGMGERFWHREKVSDAQGPGGVGIGFSETKEAVSELNTRVSSQMEDVNKRLYDLETAVFKGTVAGERWSSRLCLLECSTGVAPP
jgi:hypothetical protein